MKYELIVIWSTGEKEKFSFGDRKTAEKTAENLRMVFGNQISWTGVRGGRL